MKAPEVEKRSKKERERGAKKETEREREAKKETERDSGAKKETERGRGSFCSGYETTRTSRIRRSSGKSRSGRWSQEAQVDKTSRKWHKSKVASVSLHRRKKQQKARPRSPLSPFCGASLQRVIAYGHRGAPGGEVSASRVRERGDRVPLKFRRRVFSLMVATPMTLSLHFVVHFLASSTSFFSPISLPKESIHTYLLKNDRTRESMVRKGSFV